MATTDDFEIGTSNLNNTLENSAKVGEVLQHPEKGWKRYDDKSRKISFIGNWTRETFATDYKNTDLYTTHLSDSFCFKFFGTKFRLIGCTANNHEKNIKLTIDENNITFSQYSDSTVRQVMFYESDTLALGMHTISVSNTREGSFLSFDAIDIDDAGYLVETSLTLDNITLTLPVDTSKQLTAIATPAAIAGLTWISSDPSVATVDSTGKVTAIKEGTCNITATSKVTLGDESHLNATCVLTVIQKRTEPIGDGNLFIELVDGQIKSYQVTASKIEDFKQWCLDRDNTKSNKPYYEFSKGSYKDYVVYEKIVWFEVR